MATLKAQFKTAVTNSKKLSARPDNATLLKIYSLYKQATEGDCSGKRPGTDEAMQDYVDLIESLG